MNRNAATHLVSPGDERHSVFVSYSHTDAKFVEELRPHILSLRRKVDLWDDTRIKPGSKWRQEIQRSLSNAEVGILVLSASALASPVIMKQEVPALLRAERERHLMLLLLIARPFSVKYEKRFTKFQMVNPVSKSLIEMPKGKRERVYVRLVETMRDSPSLPG